MKSIEMKSLFLIPALVAAVLCCSGAQAASMEASIPAIWEISGMIYFEVTSIVWHGPQTTCTPATPMYMIDPSTAVGRAQLALVLTAKEANHRVYLVGDGVCVGGGPNAWLAESLTGIQVTQ